MIDYIGDISKADAEVLKLFAETHFNILEFGVGASTQIIANYSANPIISIDTSQEWIDITKRNLDKFNIPVNKVVFKDWGTLDVSVNNQFDFVFDDGVDHLRRQFGLMIWPYIKIGGWLGLHDNRRKPDFDNSLAIIEQYWEQVDMVYFNHRHSNITLIQKKVPEPYDNWQISENRTPQQLGY